MWSTGRRTLSGAMVAARRLWFDPCLVSATRMHCRSTWRTEEEAIRWATSGLVRIQGILAGTRILLPARFAEQFPHLDATLVAATSRALLEYPRSGTLP